MRKNFTIFMITLLVALLSGTVSAQRLAVKSNLLYDITSTINLGVEYEVAPRWTLEMSVNYNPWSFSDNKKMKLWMLQPEARYAAVSPVTFSERICWAGSSTTAVCFLSASPLHYPDWAVSATRVGWREPE